MSLNEEALLRKYVESFNAHDIEAVMNCFDADAVVIDHEGRRHEGRDAIRGFYEWQFRVIPDGRCELRHIVAQPGSGMDALHRYGCGHGKDDRGPRAGSRDVRRG
jgi:ketosteroid isomerase-like protein